MSNSKILVTGGAGFIGSHLVDKLAGSGQCVRVIDNLSRGKLAYLEELISRGMVEFIHTDLRDPQAIQEAIAGIETIFHLAAQSRVMDAEDDPKYTFHSNVLGTYQLLQTARVAGSVKRIVFASSREVYGEVTSLPVSEDAPLGAKNSYGISKIAGEAYCGLYNSPDMRVSILRLANVYGPRDHGRVIPLFIEKLKQEQSLSLFGGEQIIDFISVDLVVDAFLKTSQVMPQKPINIGSGKGIAVRELAERIKQMSGSRISIDTLPAREIEVSQFIAQTDQMKKILGIIPPDDPLSNLGEMI